MFGGFGVLPRPRSVRALRRDFRGAIGRRRRHGQLMHIGWQNLLINRHRGRVARMGSAAPNRLALGWRLRRAGVARRADRRLRQWQRVHDRRPRRCLTWLRCWDARWWIRRLPVRSPLRHPPAGWVDSRPPQPTAFPAHPQTRSSRSAICRRPGGVEARGIDDDRSRQLLCEGHARLHHDHSWARAISKQCANYCHATRGMPYHRGKHVGTKCRARFCHRASFPPHLQQRIQCQNAGTFPAMERASEPLERFPCPCSAQ